MDDKNELLLILPYCPSVNHYWLAKGKLRFLSQSAKKFRQEVSMLCGIAMRNSPKTFPFTGRLNVSINVWPPDARKRDVDNILKGCLDSLTHAGVYHDDSQIDKLTVRRCSLDRPHGRLEVFIKEILEVIP